MASNIKSWSTDSKLPYPQHALPCSKNWVFFKKENLQTKTGMKSSENLSRAVSLLRSPSLFTWCLFSSCFTLLSILGSRSSVVVRWCSEQGHVIRPCEMNGHRHACVVRATMFAFSVFVWNFARADLWVPSHVQLIESQEWRGCGFSWYTKRRC